jgi:predicted enzyme related to lactoylglutathione lyase
MPQFEIANGHESAAQAKRLGATMHREPAPFADVGKVAFGADPGGIAFAMREPAKTAEDVGWSGPAHTFCWAELYTPVVSSAVSFYKVFAGFTPTASQLADGPYYLLERDGQPRAGLRAPLPGVQPGWFPWVRVPDVARTAATAQGLEATIVMPAANGRALLVDPWGATLGLAQ